MKNAKKQKEEAAAVPLSSKIESQDFLKNGLSSSAFIVSGFSGISYLVAASYQKAYLSFFEVDERFVELSIETVVLTLSFLITGLVLFYQLMNLVLSLQRVRILLFIFRTDLYSAVMVLIVYHLTGVTWFTIALLVLLLFLLLNHLIGVSRKSFSGHDWKSWFREWGEPTPKIVRASKNLDDHLIETVGFSRWIIIVVAIFVLPGLGNLVGHLAARNSTKFQSYLVDGSEFVLVAQKGETLLFAEVVSGKASGKTLLARPTPTVPIILTSKKFENGIEPVVGRARKPSFSEWWSSVKLWQDNWSRSSKKTE